MWHSDWLFKMSASCLFGGIVLMFLGNFVASHTFLKMRLTTERRTMWSAVVSGLWISPSRAKAIESQYALSGGSPKVISANRMANRATLAGAASLLTGLVTMCFMITH